MAARGKGFEYLFRRDLGRLSGPKRSLAKQLVYSGAHAAQGTLTIGWRFVDAVSNDGEVDAELGRVLYRFPPPPPANPQTELRLEWRLTFNELMWEWWAGFYYQGTLMGQREHVRIACHEHHCEPRNPWTNIVNPTLFLGMGFGEADAKPWPP